MKTKSVQLCAISIKYVMLAACSFGICAVTFADEPEDKLSTRQPLSGKFSKANTYDIDYRIVLTPPAKSKLLKVWLPLPQNDKAQQISEISFSTFPGNVEPQINIEKRHGNKFAYFEFANPIGAQIIEFRFRARVAQSNWNVNLAKVRPVDQWPTDFKKYLKSDFDDQVQKEFDSVLEQIVPRKNGNALDVEAILDWTNDNLTYSHSNASLTADAKHALDQRQGHCSDYHGLCSALGRKLGYPARVTYGLAMFNKRSPSHCKLEVFLPPHGWVMFDVSETQKMIKSIKANQDLTEAARKKLAAAARKRLLSGFRDNTWLQVTKGTNFALAPAANAKTVPLIRTIYAESDGKPLEEPDPSNADQTKFSWMTAINIRPAKKVKYPFKDINSLK